MKYLTPGNIILLLIWGGVGYWFFFSEGNTPEESARVEYDLFNTRYQCDERIAKEVIENKTFHAHVGGEIRDIVNIETVSYLESSSPVVGLVVGDKVVCSGDFNINGNYEKRNFGLKIDEEDDSFLGYSLSVTVQ